MSIKAVAFDYGGVICFPPPIETVEELEKLTGLSSAQLVELNRKFRDEYDRGACNGEGHFRTMLSNAGIFLDETSLWKIAQTDMDGWKHINADTVQLIRDVKKAGAKLAIFSNMPFDFLVWARENLPVFKEVDAAVFSCEHYLLKPETEFFEILKSQLDLDYSEIVFFDDSIINIDKACELGIKGFLWTSPGEAREILKKAGISV